MSFGDAPWKVAICWTYSFRAKKVAAVRFDFKVWSVCVELVPHAVRYVSRSQLGMCGVYVIRSHHGIN